MTKNAPNRKALRVSKGCLHQSHPLCHSSAAFLLFGVTTQRNWNHTRKISISHQQSSYSMAGEGEEPVITGYKCLHWPGNCKLPLIAPNCWHCFSSSGTGTANICGHCWAHLLPPTPGGLSCCSFGEFSGRQQSQKGVRRWRTGVRAPETPSCAARAGDWWQKAQPYTQRGFTPWHIGKIDQRSPAGSSC